MALPRFADLFIDNLTEERIDSINAELDLKTLRDLCLSYNNSLPVERAIQAIEIDEILPSLEIPVFSNDKIAFLY